MSGRSRRAPLASRCAGLLGIALACAPSCAGHADALARGQRHYEDNQYERALALWRDLDRRRAAFSPRERARFAYFRGMTDYRLGFRDDARHWLAIAKAADVRQPGALDPSWLERLEGALADLGREALGLRPDGGDVVQTIELSPESAPSDPTSGAGRALDPPAVPSGSVPAADEPAPGEVTPADPAAPAVPDPPDPTGVAPAGEPLSTDPSSSPRPWPRR